MAHYHFTIIKPFLTSPYLYVNARLTDTCCILDQIYGAGLWGPLGVSMGIAAFLMVLIAADTRNFTFYRSHVSQGNYQLETNSSGTGTVVYPQLASIAGLMQFPCADGIVLQAHSAISCASAIFLLFLLQHISICRPVPEGEHVYDKGNCILQIQYCIIYGQLVAGTENGLVQPT
ncbi:hypothetical protein EWB00_001820 [Schistosoma japonicum]|uniref:Uncharacterized protein n=1 Tax=Schistosoma japonicum TaxID=6182 RepID=A0A4Z2CJY7_SCHJA|nr:hypothetical protein EWB00_001820 [Schistosoma japonicum]